MWDCSDDYMDYYAEAGYGMMLNPDLRGDKVPVPAPLPTKSALLDALQQMASKVKNLEESLIMC